MAILAPEFRSNRMLRDYVENYYAPAISQYRRRIDNHAAVAKQLADWQQQLAQHWSAIYMQKFQVEPLESGYRLSLHVYLDELPAEFVSVEVFADAQDNNKFFSQSMERKAALPCLALSMAIYTKPLSRQIVRPTTILRDLYPIIAMPISLLKKHTSNGIAEGLFDKSISDTFNFNAFVQLIVYQVSERE